MSKKQTSEALVWKAIAEALAGRELDLNAVSERVYTNASGKLHIDLDGLIPASNDNDDSKDDVDTEAESAGEAVSEGSDVVSEAADDTPLSNPMQEGNPPPAASEYSTNTTSNTVSVLDLLTSRAPTEEAQVKKPVDPKQMSSDEQDNYLANMMKEMV